MKRATSSPLGQARYRVRQFLEAVNPSRPHGNGALERLTPAQLSLFRRMHPDTQRHCLSVYHDLAMAGEQDQEVLLAALLHDSGKEQVAVGHRVATVMLEALWPPLLARLGREDKGWRRGLYRNLRHARRGAELAAVAGAPTGAVALIRAHHDPAGGSDSRLARLQAADSQG